MANVRLTCPSCRSLLEIGSEHLGQEVECGNCLRPFVAEAPRPPAEPRSWREASNADAGPRVRPSYPRHQDGTESFDPARGESGGTGVAIAALVFGILSMPLVCCCYLNVPFAIVGIVCGIIALQSPNGRGLAVAALTLSVVSLMLRAGLFAFGVGWNMLNFPFGR